MFLLIPYYFLIFLIFEVLESAPVPTKDFPLSLNFLYFSPELFSIVFTSAWAITGKVLAYNKNKTKKNPIVPTKMLMSTKVGENIVHDDGK